MPDLFYIDWCINNLPVNVVSRCTFWEKQRKNNTQVLQTLLPVLHQMCLKFIKQHKDEGAGKQFAGWTLYWLSDFTVTACISSQLRVLIYWWKFEDKMSEFYEVWQHGTFHLAQFVFTVTKSRSKVCFCLEYNINC